MLRKKNNPKIRLSRTSLLTIIDSTAALILLFVLVLAAMYWQHMPDRIPTHFNIMGQPDGWGGKSSFLGFPVLSLILFVMLTVFSFFPYIGNYPWEITEENAQRQYHLVRLLLGALKVEIMAIFLYFEWMTIQVGMERAVRGMSVFMPVMMGVIFGTIAVYIVMGWRAR